MPFEQFNWADWVILSIILLSSLMSLRRGFVKEALSLVTWLAAFIVARLFSDSLAILLEPYIDLPSFRAIAAFMILFIATLILGALVSFIIGELVKLTGLSGTDRLLGIFFGVARGLILVIALVAVLGLTPITRDPWWQQSSLIPQFELMVEWSKAKAEQFISSWSV